MIDDVWITALPVVVTIDAGRAGLLRLRRETAAPSLSPARHSGCMRSASLQPVRPGSRAAGWPQALGRGEKARKRHFWAKYYQPQHRLDVGLPLLCDVTLSFAGLQIPATVPLWTQQAVCVIFGALCNH